MKKISLLLVMFMAALAFTACDKEDDDNFSIVGTWEQEKMEMTIAATGMDEWVETDTTPTTIVFNEGGTGTATYLEEGQTVTDNFTWTLSNDVLTIIDSEMALTLKLTTMTDTRLVGEQTLTMAEMAEFNDLSEEDAAFLEMFPNLTAKIVITLVKQ